MAEPIEGKQIWNSAGKAGIVLGGVSIIYLLANMFLGKIGGTTATAFLSSLCSLILWLIKFAGCILLMKYFMKKFASSHQGVTNNTTFKYGVVVALCSSTLFSAFYLLYTAYLAPATYTEAIESVMSSYSNMLSASDIESIENMTGKLPTIGFFANWIYCFLFGVILSSILSRNIPSRNPFENNDSF